MPATPAILIASSALVIAFLGGIHLWFTVASDKFDPRDRELKARLETVSPVLTSRTTMWKAWVGFNISHSLGALLYGAVYGYLALCRYEVLIGSAFLLAVGAILLVAYFVVGRRYWFSTPFRGIALALVLYFAGVGMAWAR